MTTTKVNKEWIWWTKLDWEPGRGQSGKFRITCVNDKKGSTRKADKFWRDSSVTSLHQISTQRWDLSRETCGMRQKKITKCQKWHEIEIQDSKADIQNEKSFYFLDLVNFSYFSYKTYFGFSYTEEKLCQTLDSNPYFTPFHKCS